MFPEISYEFSARDYKSIFELQLKEREIDNVQECLLFLSSLSLSIIMK
jgi:hypothetical protein